MRGARAQGSHWPRNPTARTVRAALRPVHRHRTHVVAGRNAQNSGAFAPAYTFETVPSPYETWYQTLRSASGHSQNRDR